MKITAPKKLTKDCFKDFSYRDSDLDAWLPKTQPARSGEVSVLTPPADMTFLEMAQHFLGTQDPEEIKKHCLTLPMVEELIQSADTNGMKTDGYANFFFVENKDGSVSVANVCRRDGGRHWRADVLVLADSYRWSADRRLLVCNLDTRANYDPSTLSSDFEARLEKVEIRLEQLIGSLHQI